MAASRGYDPNRSVRAARGAGPMVEAPNERSRHVRPVGGRGSSGRLRYPLPLAAISRR